VNSWKKAALEVGESYVIHNFDESGRTVTVAFTGIESNAAVVEITPETSESPTISPIPSSSPSASPSSSPSSSPSYSPSFSPTQRPTASPSSSPSYSPSYAPTVSPTEAPTAQATATTTFFTTTATTTTTTFQLTETNTTVLATNETVVTVFSNATANATLCDEELFLNISIRTDFFPEETSWILKMIGGGELDQVEPSTYQTPFANFESSYCLEYDTCYLFKIFDTSADGMGFVGETTAEPGYYQANLGSEQQFRKVGSWGAKKVHKFCTPPSPLDMGNETDIDFDFEEDFDEEDFDEETDADLLD